MAAPIPEFDERIENLAGVIHSDEEAVKQWLVDGCYDVVRKIQISNPPAIHQFVAKSSDIVNGTAQSTDEIKDIISVARAYYTCREVPFTLKREVEDSGSIHYATATDPVFLKHNGLLSIYPDPAADPNHANYYYLPDYLIQNYSSGTSAIDDFPSQYYEHICVYAAIQVLNRRLLDKDDVLPDDISELVLSNTTLSLPTFSAPSGIVLPSIPTAPTMSEKSVSITGLAPLYTKPTINLDTIAIAPLSISATSPSTIASPAIISSGISSVTKASISANQPEYIPSFLTLESQPVINNLLVSAAPSPPTLEEVRYIGAEEITDVSGSVIAPTYTKPTLTLIASPTITDLNMTAVAPVVPTLSTVSYTSPDGAVSGTELGSLTLTAADVPNVIGLAPNYTEPTDKPVLPVVLSNFIISDITVPTVPSIFGIGIFDSTVLAEKEPTYQAPVPPSISSLNITATVPSVPGLIITNVDVDSLTFPTFISPVLNLDYADAENWINVEEDEEMLAARTSLMSTQLSEYTAKISEAKAVYDKDVKKFDSQWEELKQNADFQDSAIGRDLEKYSAEITAYSAEVDATIKEFNTATTADIQLYNAQIQNATHIFKNELAIYQEQIKGMQLKSSGEQITLQKYTQEFDGYVKQVSTRIEEFKANNDVNMQNYQAALSLYQANMQNELNKFNKESVVYQSAIQAELARYNNETSTTFNQAKIDLERFQNNTSMRLNDSQLAQARTLENALKQYEVLVQNNSQELAKYTQLIGAYQTDINKEIQEYQANSQKDIEIWEKDNASKLQEYSQNIQNELNKFNEENVKFQVLVQRTMTQPNIDLANNDKGMEVIIQNNNKLLAKFQSELTRYQHNINREVTQYQHNTQKDIELWQQNNTLNLQKYGQDMQNGINQFNQENAIYQASIQSELAKFNADVQDAQKEGDMTLQASIQDYQLQLQKFSQDVAKYQADVNTEVQEYTNTFQKDFQLWQVTRQTDLQKHSNDMQNEMNEFNQENAAYQATLQKDLQDAQLAESKEGRDLQKYNNELSAYQAEIQAQVQLFQTTLQTNMETFNTGIAKYNAEAGKINADNQSTIGKFSQDIANYGAKIQKDSVQYGWLTNRLMYLKQQYNELFGIPTSPVQGGGGER